MPSVRISFVLGLALVATSCAHEGRPRSLASLGVVFSHADEGRIMCGTGLSARAKFGERPNVAARLDAEEKLMWSEASVAQVIESVRRSQKVGLSRIHWDLESKRSRLLCNKSEKLCVLSLRPGDVMRAPSVAELLEDLPLAQTKQSLTIP